jgi:hypothetical protein
MSTGAKLAAFSLALAAAFGLGAAAGAAFGPVHVDAPVDHGSHVVTETTMDPATMGG